MLFTWAHQAFVSLPSEEPTAVNNISQLQIGLYILTQFCFTYFVKDVMFDVALLIDALLRLLHLC